MFKVTMQDMQMKRTFDIIDFIFINITEDDTALDQEFTLSSQQGVWGIVYFGFSYQVSCAANFTGPRCDVCFNLNCGMHGECVHDFQDGTFTCACQDGFTGEFCHVQDECFTKCVNGSCMNQGNSFVCVCQDGFTGEFCDARDRCFDIDCGANGSCMNQDDSFMCACQDGFAGEFCDIYDECLVKCVNGSCVGQEGSSTCACQDGFTGEFCEARDECHGINCGSGECVPGDGGGAYSCHCNSGFTGNLCETDVDECVNISCSGRGECIESVNSFSCSCESGYSGTLCQGISIYEMGV